MSHTLDSAASAWSRVHFSRYTAVTDARLQLHHAAQVANAPAMSYLPPAPDDSHTNFGWSADLRAFVSQRVTLPEPRRFAVRPADLTLLALDDAGRTASTFPLAGATLAHAHAWARQECAAAHGDPARYTDRKHYEIPGHAVSTGAAFGADADALSGLARLWGNVVPLLDAVAESQLGSSSVRLWPHHFDVGLILTLDTRRSIGVGFTPGDHYYDEPYWYVSPYPTPVTSARPTLSGGGHWHDHEFFSAVLPWSAYAEPEDLQGGQVARYLSSALAGTRELLAP